MLEEVYKWIQNIAVYLVVVTAMLHAVPGKDYERYIRFASVYRKFSDIDNFKQELENLNSMNKDKLK